jgi:hypothetical protein
LRLSAIAFAVSLPSAAIAQSGSAHMNARFELEFNCERPLFVRNAPVHADFDAVLNPDKTASADLVLSSDLGPGTSTVHFDARLGGRPQPAPGGISQLRVTSSHQLRAIWDLPNNQLILDINAVRRADCLTTLKIGLKPGRREYTMFDGQTLHYCSKYRLLGGTCQARLQ